MNETPSAPLPEQNDVSNRWIQIVGWSFVGLLIFIALFLWAVFGSAIKSWLQGMPQYSLEPYPAPRLLADPERALKRVREREQEELQRYSWTDSTHQYARVPPARAMKILAAKKLIKIQIDTGETKHVR